LEGKKKRGATAPKRSEREDEPLYPGPVKKKKAVAPKEDRKRGGPMTMGKGKKRDDSSQPKSKRGDEKKGSLAKKRKRKGSTRAQSE